MALSQTEKTTVGKIAASVRTACVAYVTQTKKRAPFQLDCFRAEELDCMCAIASRLLAEELVEHGFPAKVTSGEFDGFGHAWVTVNGMIVDITRKQFSETYPDVFIGGPKSKWYRRHMDGPPTQADEIFREWPTGQLPSSKRMQAIRRFLPTQPNR